MSASSMTAFVRNLFKQTNDYRTLTQRIIRDLYMQHANVDSLDDDQRSLLREIVQIMVAEMVQSEESQISNERADERPIYSSSIKDKSVQNSKQTKHAKASTNKETNIENDKEEDRPQKKKKLECPEDLGSDSEGSSLAKNRKSKSKIADSSSESDVDRHSEAKYGNATAVNTQHRMKNKTVSQKEDSDLSAPEQEDSDSESEKGQSGKISVLSRPAMKNSKKSKAVLAKTKLPALSSIQSSKNEDFKPKKLKKATTRKRKSSESSDSQLSSAVETDPESDGSEFSKPQEKTRKKQSKTEIKIVSRKRKLSSSSEVEPPSNKLVKSDSRKRIQDSDESSDGESLQRIKTKMSSTNKASEVDDKAYTQDDIGRSRSKVDKSKSSLKTVNKGKAFSIDSSGSEDEEKLANIKKTSSDSDESLSAAETLKETIKAQEKRKSEKSTQGKKPSKTQSQGDDKDEHVKKLEKIARSCGILPVGRNYKLAFEHCQDNKERLAKLKQMLRDAGMTGSFSMKSAERLKLKREAEELLSNNVIISEGRRRRSASNPFSANCDKRRDRESSSSPNPPARENFSRLKGIVDSEEDSD